jgi:GntR family transcriptional regulator
MLIKGGVNLKARVKAIYNQIADDLKAKIMSGDLAPREMLPSQSQMAETYGVSQMTVRQGLGLLVDDGYIYSVWGKGYFVAEPTLDTLVINLSGENFFGQKLNPTVNKVEVLHADRTMVDKLGVQPKATVLRVQLTLTSGKVPVALDYRYIPYRKGEPLLEKELQYADFPNIVARHTNLVVAKSNFTIEAVPLSAAEAEALEVSSSAWGLCVEQVLYDITGKPLGWSRMVCRSDRYKVSGVAQSYSGKV